MRCKHVLFVRPSQDSIPSSFGGDLAQRALCFSTTDATISVLFTSVKPLTYVTFSTTTNQVLVYICRPPLTSICIRFGKKFPEGKNPQMQVIRYSLLHL